MDVDMAVPTACSVRNRQIFMRIPLLDLIEALIVCQAAVQIVKQRSLCVISESVLQ